MGALASGALTPGVLLNSLGSAEYLTLALPASTAELELTRRGYSQGVVEFAQPVPAASRPRARIERFRGLFGGDLSHGQLIAEAEDEPPCCHGTTFLPDLRGRISPTPDPLASGPGSGSAATPRAERSTAPSSKVSLRSAPDRRFADRAAGAAAHRDGAYHRRQHQEPAAHGNQGSGLRSRDRGGGDGRGDGTRRGAARRLHGRRVPRSRLSRGGAGLEPAHVRALGRTGSRSRRALSARLSAGPCRLRPLHHAAAALETAAGLTARPPG